MLKGFFSKASEDFSRKVDLSDAEKQALNALGKDLPELGGDSLARTFSNYISMGWKGLHTIKAEGETIVKYSLYNALNSGGNLRMPRVKYSYSSNICMPQERAEVQVDFLPDNAVRPGPHNTGAMIPLILSAPRHEDGRIDYDRINDDAAIKILKYAEMRQPHLPSNPQPAAPEAK